MLKSLIVCEGGEPMKTKLEAKVVALGVFIGDDTTLEKQTIELTLEGIVGDLHGGFSKPADGRDQGIKRGTPLRNWRQWSAVSLEELNEIAQRLGIDRLDPRLLTANITFAGVANFTQIPRGSMLTFASGAMLLVEEENEPCLGPGKLIARQFPAVPAHKFPKVAMKLRGLVGVVHRSGTISTGDTAEIEIYEPKLYAAGTILSS